MIPIAINLSPNTETKDVSLALRLLFSPSHYINGSCIVKLEEWFRIFFSVSHAISFSSGRAALIAIMRALSIGEGDEVLLQAFTCVAVPNAILMTGGKPIYVDIQKNLTIDTQDLQKKISKKTKAIIVQHTFGIPSDMGEILKIAKNHNLFVIEDCAHTVGGMFGEKKLGTFGVASFFSFGRDKAFSSVFGGMAITNDRELGSKIKTYQESLEFPSFSWTLQQLFHPIAFSFILPLYNRMNIGKVILVALQKLHLLSFPVSQGERKGRTDNVLLKKMPNVLSCLALFQLKRVDAFNAKRIVLSKIYIDEFNGSDFGVPYQSKIPYLRFPLLVSNREEVLLTLRKKGIILHKWYAEVVSPEGVDFGKVGYEFGFCKNAEEISKKILNLPCYPTMGEEDAKKIVQLVKRYGS